MNQFQKLNFSSIEDFLVFLPKSELRIVEELRHIVLPCFAHPIERLSYNVPFYYQNSRICFIWPSSIPWGKVPGNGVQLGFSKGFLMRDEIGYLEKGSRKQVYCKTFYSFEDIDHDLVKTYVLEAIRIDQEV